MGLLVVNIDLPTWTFTRVIWDTLFNTAGWKKQIQIIFDPVVRNQAGKERERRLDKVFVFFQRAFC